MGSIDVGAQIFSHDLVDRSLTFDLATALFRESDRTTRNSIASIGL
jgi:hypothetical protein